MKTERFGAPETRTQHPLHPEVNRLILSIFEKEAELDPLRRKLAKLRLDCDHYFIPTVNNISVMSAVPGVFAIGEMMNAEKSTTDISLICTRCAGDPIHRRVEECCPRCAAPTRSEVVQGKMGMPNPALKYFPDAHAYHQLVLISCTKCAFKAAGYYWDR